MRSPAPGLCRIVGDRRGYRFRIVREDHALPGLPCVDAENGLHRHPDIVRHPRETRPEADRSIRQLEIVCRGLTDVEYDAAVLDMLARNIDAIDSCIARMRYGLFERLGMLKTPDSLASFPS